jgi:hypothetical protein
MSAQSKQTRAFDYTRLIQHTSQRTGVVLVDDSESKSLGRVAWRRGERNSDLVSENCMSCAVLCIPEMGHLTLEPCSARHEISLPFFANILIAP